MHTTWAQVARFRIAPYGYGSYTAWMDLRDRRSIPIYGLGERDPWGRKRPKNVERIVEQLNRHLGGAPEASTDRGADHSSATAPVGD